MIFLLPPSETKREGGSPGSSLDFAALSFGTLDRRRRSAVSALVRLSRNAEASMSALKLGPRLRGEVERNRLLKVSPTLPAIDRYTGVVYDALDSEGLTPAARQWAHEHVVVHSALFGLVSALDPIPAYRLSHDSRLPDLSLRRHWSTAISRALGSRGDPVIDLRSEAYVELGTAPAGSVYTRIVSDATGRRRALNHFNKKSKGLLVNRLARSRPELASVDDLVEWARGEAIGLERHGDDLVVVSETLLGQTEAISR